MSETSFVQTSQSSRDLDVKDRSFEQVVWRQGAPILDSELNLMAQISNDKLEKLLTSQAPSGFIARSLTPKADFQAPASAVNKIKLAPMVANIRGKLLDVRSSDSDGAITLEFSSTTTLAKNYLVYLAVWESVLKPTVSGGNSVSPNIPKYGNFGQATTVSSDLVDVSINLESSHRVQTQYQILITEVSSLSGSLINIKPKGISSLDSAFTTLSNTFMADGDLYKLDVSTSLDIKNGLNLVSPYIYALPICVVSRRASDTYAEPLSGGNEYLAGDRGSRPDGKISGYIYPEDILDVRSHVSLCGWNNEELLVKNLDRLFTGKLSSKSPTRPIVAQAYSEGASANPLTVLSTMTSGRTTYSDSVHSQTYDFFFKFSTADTLEGINPQSGAGSHWASFPSISGTSGFSSSFNASTPYTFNSHSFIKIPLAAFKPGALPKQVVYSGKPVRSYDMKTGIISENIGVLGKKLTSFTVNSSNWVPTTKKITRSTKESAIVDISKCKAVIELDIPGTTQYSTRGVYSLSESSTSGNFDGYTLSDLTASLNALSASQTFTVDVYSTEIFEPADTTIILYSKNNGSIANVQLDFLYKNSPGFTGVASRVHHLKLINAGTSFVEPSITTSSPSVRHYKPRHLSAAPNLKKLPKDRYTSQFYIEPTSKTVVFQPYQFDKFSLQVSTSVLAKIDIDNNYLKGTLLKSLFKNASSNYSVFNLPLNLQQPEGWFDIPAIPYSSTVGDHKFGHHFLFEDAIAKANPFLTDLISFKVSKSENNLGTDALYDVGGSAKTGVYAWYDSQRGLIKLPACIGPGRVLGAYDITSNAPQYNTYQTLYTNTGTDPNLLDRSSKQKTLYRENNHFYIPTNLIRGFDLSNCENYIIDIKVFGFAPISIEDDNKITSVFIPATNTTIPTTYPTYTDVDTVFFGPMSETLPVSSTTSTPVAYIVYSNEPYQGTKDSSGLYLPNYTDIPIVNPSDTVSWYQVISQKTFATTLGTGKVAGVTNLLSGVDLKDSASLMDSSFKEPTVSDIYNGLTSRLPLGYSYQDSQFRGEKLPNGSFLMLSDGWSDYSSMPSYLTVDGEPIQEQVAVPGSIIGVKASNNTANTDFRYHRGSGSAFVLGPDNKPFPLTWFSGVLPKDSLISRVLFGSAYLVRNLTTNKIQMLVATSVMESPQLPVTSSSSSPIPALTEDLPLFGKISPKGAGHGLAAVDIFDLEENPVFNGPPALVPTSVDLTKLPE